MDSCSIAAGGSRLLEGRQDHRSTSAPQRFGKCLVRRRVGRRAEIDVEYDVPDTSDFQPPQQVGVEAARPRPDTDFLDRGGVDRNDDNITAGLTRYPAEPQIGQ